MPSSVLDSGHAGMRLEDFLSHPSAVAAELDAAQVLALRLYSSSVYRTINNPLRDGCSTERPHPYPATVAQLTTAISALRKVHEIRRAADPNAEGHPTVLYRGVRDFDISDEFKARGGTELAVMSTTRDRAVAEEYATKDGASFSLLFELKVPNAMQCGADIGFASCFPGEVEYVYPPGTYLQLEASYAERMGLKRNSSRPSGLGAAAGRGSDEGGGVDMGVEGSTRIRVVKVVPTFGMTFS
jgi:hypothetical protein